ncbi:hypothetical protein [Nocardioides marmoraquaticus]
MTTAPVTVVERVTAGLVRAELRLRGAAQPRSGATAVRSRPTAAWWALLALVLVGQVVVASDVQVPVLRQAVGLLVLVLVPTWLLCPSLGWVQERQRALTALGLVLLGVVAGAMLLDVGLPRVGVDEPLRAPWIALASTVVDVGLLVRQRATAATWLVSLGAAADHLRTARVHAALALSCTGLVLSVLGAVRLNNGAGAGLTVGAFACVVVALLAMVVMRGSSLRTDGMVVFTSALTLLLATSLRGWYVQGHDIQLEHVSFLLVDQAGRWSMSQFDSPYHACLAVNVLPVVLGEVTGLSGAWVFKVLMQVLFALVPVQCYLWFRQLLPRPMAVLAVVLVVAFPTFTTDMPYLVRQEVAFYFFTLALLAAHPRAATTGGRRVLWRTRALVLVFLVAMMLSHYSTTYVVLITTAIGGGLVVAERLVLRRRGQEASRKPLVLLAWPVVVGLALATFVWVNPVTGTGGHAGDVFRSAIASLTEAREATESSSDLGNVPFLGGGPTAQERLDDHSAQALEQAAALGYPDGGLGLPDRANAPRIDEPDPTPLTGLGRAAADRGIDVPGANEVLRSAFALGLQLALLVGAFFLVRGHRLTAAYDRERVWLTVGGVGALGVFAVVPGLSVDYGVLRVFQQGLMVFAPAVVLGFVMVATPLGRWRTPVVAGFVMASLATLAGFVPAITGGVDQPRPSYSATGPYQELYGISPQEVAGAGWLRDRGVVEDGLPTVTREPYSDERLSGSVAIRENAPYVFPSLVARDVPTLLGQSVVQRQRAAVFASGDLLFYRYPLGAVQARKDLVYSNPSAVVLQ